jgi:DNA polymerase III gamma/tau subunit
MHLKHRPKSFDEVMGNTHIINSINFHYENTGTYESHTMFEGLRGCGKTTLAYIIANKFCKEKENIKLINCVNLSSVNDMRTLVDEFPKSSIFGRKKVYILDEIHRLSPQAQEILLVELEKEELVGRVLVIACTTTLNKVLKTLIERFIQYRVRPLSNKEAKELIDKICELENIKLDKYTKVTIIEKSEGIPRKILTAIPKVIGITNRQEIDYLLDLNNMEDDKGIFNLFKFILNTKLTWKEFSAILKDLYKTKSPNDIRHGLMNLISGRLMSPYLSSETEGMVLSNCFKILRREGFPEKANVTVSIFDVYKEYKMYTKRS